MKAHAFIFNWPGQTGNIARLKEKISPYATVTVINSDNSAIEGNPDWCNLGGGAFFSEQWNAAIRSFSGDVFFHIQADADCACFDRLFSRAARFLARPKVAIYEPYVDFTDITYSKPKLDHLDDDVFEIPVSDCTCWFLKGSIISSFRPIDLSINRLGWGVPFVAAALARLAHQCCVRDYQIKVDHPKGRGYSSRLALSERTAFFKTLPEVIQAEIQSIMTHRDSVRY